MTTARLAFLIRAYFNKTATAAEREELMDVLKSSENDEALKNELEKLWEEHSSQRRVFSESQGEEMLSAILQTGRTVKPIAAGRPKSKLVWLQRAAAAAVLIGMVAGAYWWLNYNPETKKTAQSSKTPTTNTSAIVPGGNKAVLTLADGTSILLDSAHLGALAKQGNAKVINLSSAVLTYHGENDKGQGTIYNTLSTPKGGQYSLVLTDGTKVWLNASSSIHFPVAFNGKERNVVITGEAYFEVAKNAAKPFTVTVGDATVQVLGTNFNINAYDDERYVRTTLLEGSVKVMKGTASKLLLPGQQLKISQEGMMKMHNPDLEEVMAWKNGWFKFASNDIQTIMRQVARWYDIDVAYEGKIPEGHYSGFLSRQNNISQVLQIMQSDINFKIEGKKVTVYNANP